MPTTLAMLEREHNAPGCLVSTNSRRIPQLRQLLTFTVELCGRASSDEPILRGVYFSGVRPVEVREAVRQRGQTQGGMSDATGVFTGAGMEAAQAAPSVQVRRLPQWVFTHRLFNEVILRDQAAFGASARSVGTDMARRLLLGGTAALALLLMTLWTVSFFKNRGLQAEVKESVQAIGQARTDSQNLAPADALRRLEALRQNAELLSRYGREGAPS